MLDKLKSEIGYCLSDFDGNALRTVGPFVVLTFAASILPEIDLVKSWVEDVRSALGVKTQIEQPVNLTSIKHPYKESLTSGNYNYFLNSQ